MSGSQLIPTEVPGSKPQGGGLGHRDRHFREWNFWFSLPIKCPASLEAGHQPARHKQGWWIGCVLDRLSVDDWVKRPVYFLGPVSGWRCWNQHGFHKTRRHETCIWTCIYEKVWDSDQQGSIVIEAHASFITKNITKQRLLKKYISIKEN